MRNCARALAESGAQALKLEGGAELVETVDWQGRALTLRPIRPEDAELEQLAVLVGQRPPWARR